MTMHNPTAKNIKDFVMIGEHIKSKNRPEKIKPLLKIIFNGKIQENVAKTLDRNWPPPNTCIFIV